MIAFGPPSGVGVYARDQSVEWLARFGFVVLNGARSDAAEKARALIARGVRVYFYSTPENWTPARWQASIALLSALVIATRAKGFIADPETGWDDVADPEGTGAAFGRALAGVAGMMSVGVTSYPLFRRNVLAAIARAANGKVWGSPQIYGRTTLNPADFAAWMSAWRSLFGAGLVIPSVAGWVSTSVFASADAHRAYLASIPRAQGAIAWTVSSPPDHIVANLRSWNPAGNILAQGAYLARGFVSSWAGKLAMLALVILALGAVAWRYYA